MEVEDVNVVRLVGGAAGAGIDAANIVRGKARRPEETLLYEVVAQELETFLERQQERDRLVPHFVEQEFRSFLDCGVLARGSVIPH